MHADRLPNATCSRCGSFACAVCLMRSRDALVCLKCAAPRARTSLVPLENPERRLLSRIVGTWWAFIASPGDSAEDVGDGRLFAPLIFSWCCWCVPFESVALVISLAPNEPVASFAALGLGLGTIAFVVWSLLMPLGEWAALNAAGVDAPLRKLIRVASFASAPWAVPLCGCFPMGASPRSFASSPCGAR